ncbi:MAG: MauE/DoxX family redox-associated membrane protein [Candidatus Andersenbacteria bacterium]
MDYTCPMHPEIKSDMPGRCSKCGMNLVPAGTVKPQPASIDTSLGKHTWRNYQPLIVIIGLISLTTVVLAYRDSTLGTFSLATTISYFMIGFFLVFAGFKLMDLKGFAEGYSTYDLLAQRWFGYGYIYPFIELFFALAMIMNIAPRPVLWTELIVMTFSGIGVAIKIAKREQFHCACLGTFLKVPLTTVTLVEDFGMAALAGLSLILQ